MRIDGGSITNSQGVVSPKSKSKPLPKLPTSTKNTVHHTVQAASRLGTFKAAETVQTTSLAKIAKETNSSEESWISAILNQAKSAEPSETIPLDELLAAPPLQSRTSHPIIDALLKQLDEQLSVAGEPDPMTMGTGAEIAAQPEPASHSQDTHTGIQKAKSLGTASLSSDPQKTRRHSFVIQIPPSSGHSRIFLHSKSSPKPPTSGRSSGRSETPHSTTPKQSPKPKTTSLPSTMRASNGHSFLNIKAEVFPKSGEWLQEAIHAIRKELNGVPIHQPTYELTTLNVKVCGTSSNNYGLKVFQRSNSPKQPEPSSFDCIGEQGLLCTIENNILEPHYDKHTNRIYPSKEKIPMCEVLSSLKSSRFFTTSVLSCGSGLGTKYVESASKAAKTIKKKLDKLLVNKQLKVTEIIKAQLRAIEKAHNRLCKKPEDFGTTALTVATCGGGYFIASTIGRNKIFALRHLTDEDDIPDTATKTDHLFKCFEICTSQEKPAKQVGIGPSTFTGETAYNVACIALKLESKDRIIVCSEGTYANLDPDIQGKKPSEYNLQESDWNSLPEERTTIMIRNLLEVFESCHNYSAEELNDALTQFSYDMSARQNIRLFNNDLPEISLSSLKAERFYDSYMQADDSKAGFCSHLVISVEKSKEI